jgi:tetratricopeptide (TPR) repeat protein
LEAYDYFLQGQASFIKRSSAEENRQAQKLLQTAIDIDPGFARAIGALALTHADAFRFGWTDNPAATAKLALELAPRAQAMDNYSPQVHWVLGFVYLFLFAEHEKAIAIGKRTLELDPNYVDGYILLAAAYLYANEYNKALSLVEKAMRLNPHYPSQYPGVYGVSQLLLGQYDESKKWLEKSLLINPSLVYNNVYLAVLLYRMGEVEEAQWQYEQLLVFHPEFDINIWAYRQPYRDKSVSAKLVSDLQACCERE